ALEQGEKTAQAHSQAEGQRYAKENFQQGLASGPNIGVAGQGRVFVQATPQPQIPGGHPQIPGSPPLLNPGQNQQDQTKMTACTNCSQLIPIDSNFCGYCGKPIKDESEPQPTE
ncbi:MAG: zinc ribbon domain-containing protein, partial [Desulfobacteraceae bacterium]|nr:zinc ribbon domain-containing protein [Desulfobacteraceae bacterium]